MMMMMMMMMMIMMNYSGPRYRWRRTGTEELTRVATAVLFIGGMGRFMALVASSSSLGTHPGVEHIEMTGNDWNRYRYCQNTGQRARGPYQPTSNARRHLVSVPDRRHGNDGPPERVRDAVDGGVVDVELGVVDRARVEHDAGAQRDDEDAETLDAGSNSCYQHLKASCKPNTPHSYTVASSRSPAPPNKKIPGQEL